MSDLPAPLHQAAVQALDRYRLAYARYRSLLDAQHASLRAGDLGLLTTIAEEAESLLERLPTLAPLPPELAAALDGARGPAATEVQALLKAVEADAEEAHHGVRHLGVRLAEHKALLENKLERARAARPSPPGRES